MLSGKSLIRRKWLVLAVWIIAIILAVPAVMGYGSYINYSNSTTAPHGTESYKAAQILANTSERNQSLQIVVFGDVISNTSIARNMLNFSTFLEKDKISDLKNVISPASQYAKFINQESNSTGNLVKAYYEMFKNTSKMIYGFPLAFYNNWKSSNFSKSTIMSVANESGYNGSGYERAFINDIKNSSFTGLQAVNNSINQAVKSVLMSNSIYAEPVLDYLGLFNFTDNFSISKATSIYISGVVGFNLSAQFVQSVEQSHNPGIYYINHYGLAGVPSFLITNSVSPNHKISIVTVNFNVPSGYSYKNGSSPSQMAYPKILQASSDIFGNSSIVTGTGAIAIQTSQVTAKSGFAFGLIFIVLLIAIFITLVSYWSSIIALFLVGLSLLVGYVSIFITGLIIGNVSFIVNYTLTAVILGISTDYLVFIVSRFRREIRMGTSPEEAIYRATDTAGKAVIISGVTVAVTLLTFSLVPSFLDWGLVLFQAVIYTVLIQVTLLPITMYFLRKRLIMKRGLSPMNEDSHKDSLFYRTTDLSVKKAAAVAIILIVLGSAGVYFFYTVPTTYNFNTGLPQSISSVKGLNSIYNNFGEDHLFPVFLIYKANFNSSNLTTSQNNTLMKVASDVKSLDYVSAIQGPFISGKNISTAISPGSFSIDHGKYFLYIVTLKYGPYSNQAINAVNNLRANNSFVVGGLTSQIIDERAQNDRIYGSLEAFIIVAIFAILLMAFRQLRYPIIAISGTFFSISWSTFILYLISNYILHIALIYLIPIILFIILFSLGNDYTVFISSNIREEVKKDGFEIGIRRGMVNGGKTITALGLILAFSLGALSLIPVAFLEELGISFIISLIIDTFIIRTFYFPSMLTLFEKVKPSSKKL